MAFNVQNWHTIINPVLHPDFLTMTIQKLPACLFFLVILTGLSACNKETPKPQSVIINFSKALETVKLSERINEFSLAKKQAMNDELTAFSKKIRDAIDNKKSRLGEDPSEEEQKAFTAVTNNLRNQFNQRRVALNNNLREEAGVFRQSIFDEVIPVARQVAKEHGASIVLKKHQAIWSEEALDITDEVVNRLVVPQEIQHPEIAEVVEPDTTE